MQPPSAQIEYFDQAHQISLASCRMLAGDQARQWALRQGLPAAATVEEAAVVRPLVCKAAQTST